MMATLSTAATLPTTGDDSAETTTLAQIDSEFDQLGCLGHGGFGSVFLAQKSSRRRVALKFMRFELDCDAEEEQDSFSRELDAVLRLDCTSDKEGNRHLSIVYFEDWFTGPGFACIVMNYADGGTLAQEIVSKSAEGSEPYTERRIAWYALQLSEALAYAHECGVAHHDVKSANVLIDRTSGGKLLLADFGSAVAPGEESVKFTEIYASPELQVAYAREDFTGLEADKIDAFGLGCIIFEMLCCKKLVDLTGDQTLGEFIQEKQSVDAALDLPCLRLPWIPKPVSKSPATTSLVGYSDSLRSLIKALLEPLPGSRWTLSDLQKPLRQDPLSPLLADYVSAAQPPRPGAPLTMDNIQLGMFVQRGRDWNDGDSDGGPGSVGVVVKLDADAGYTEVAFPSRDPSVAPKPMCCRIGAGNKFELQVGPTPIKDFVDGSPNPKTGGIMYSTDISYTVGQALNSNCVVVAIQHTQSFYMVAPMEKIPIPALPFTLPIHPVSVGPANPRKPLSPPASWNPDLRLLAEVDDLDEKGLVVTPFYSLEGGLDIQCFEILSIKRVQSVDMWTAYARTREQVASENWGVVNERRLFHGTGRHAPEALLCSTSAFYQTCTGAASNEIHFSEDSSYGDSFSFRPPSDDASIRQMVVSRVALGRVDDRCDNDGQTPPSRPLHFQPLKNHSVHKFGPVSKIYSITNPSQAFPEYVVTYRALPRSGRRIVRPIRRPQNGSRLSRGVRHVPQRRHQRVRQLFANSPGSEHAAAANSPVVQPSPHAISTPPASHSTEEPKTPGSAAKMCVVCLERPVNRILIPCGHPCLCEVCSTSQGIAKLRRKCPECRSTIREAMRFYGKVVED